ncbi:oxidoreductase [Sphingomonas populi]|uniref:Oxidoreductase n=1 Tax=Sphingomonas populi TaxID=2484750 RepID=A0A4Q6Y2F7_9SPHN|nr:zinc-binding dehydrogenase [Sphingomonas populi]RZF63447.1 oxidoreductase [Sphingomonas populi]
MRAARMLERNGTPVLQDVPEFGVPEGTCRIEVLAAGLQNGDLMRAQGRYKVPEVPYTIGGEGVGRLPDGRRVYFGHSIPESGAVCEFTIVPEEEVWPIPDEIDDSTAIALAIAGTGALVPLELARIQPGENVLILGASGPLGQIALQLSRAMGAGRVVGAARGLAALERLKQRGIADDIVQLGQGDDAAALKHASGNGFDVVLDCLYGPPAEAALRATALGARMMSIGIQAGETMTVSLKDLFQRTHFGVGTSHRSVDERRAAYERLLDFARSIPLTVESTVFDLEDVGGAWAALEAGGVAGKIIVRVKK